MNVLGIDPGLSALGYGLVESQRGSAVYRTCGTFVTRPRDGYARRLQQIYRFVGGLIEEHHPDRIAMERPIYCQNISTALSLGQVGGLVILAAAEHGLELVEFTPLEIKKAVVGKGRAGKDQILRMVTVLLGLPEAPPSEHASDALACAICYVHSEKRIRLGLG